jgi:hypothetical protein
MLVTACVVMQAQSALAQWTRVETPNFVVYGELGSKGTRNVADEFERFREALGRLMPGAVRQTVPTVVVVFKNQRSMAPYRPSFNGKPVEIAGYFYGTSHDSVILLSVERREHALRTVFHEYAHLLIHNITRQLPQWLDEGLAEYYSTFEMQDEGRVAIMGKVIVEHLQRLNEERLIPIDELLAVTTKSPMYNEGHRRSIFYAQSWALVHMLNNGDPNRSRELTAFATLTATGTPPADAWKKVFGDVNINAQLKNYVARTLMRAYQYRFDTEIPRVKAEAVAVAQGEMDATLGDVLRKLGHADAGLARLRGAAESSPRARALLAHAVLLTDKRDEARALLLSAAGDADWLTQYYAAAGLERLLDRPATDKEAAAAFDKAVSGARAARPELPHAMALTAQLAALTGARLDEALTLIRQARNLAPGREEYAFIEADLLVQTGDFNRARQVIGPLLSERYPPEVRDLARVFMGRVVGYERARASHAERTSAGSVVTSSADAPSSAIAEESRVILELREVQPGEQRIEGQLERIDCDRAGITLHVRATEGPLRFSAAKFDGIDFITYRENMSGTIGCGPRQPPDRVYVTFRPAASQPESRGVVVAVEFLPPR